MMFNKRRQSQDSVLREKLLEISGGKLLMSSYSAKQFEGLIGVVVDDDYILNATENDYCFVEDRGFDISKVNEVVLCHWNRLYQADTIFDVDLKGIGFKSISKEDIVGSSHPKITIQTFARK
jgi:hypothetical protein